jgi:hypothetical protein
MSIDQFRISTPESHPTKAFCGEGRSGVIDSSTLDELIDQHAVSLIIAETDPRKQR